MRITNSLLERLFFLWNAGGSAPGDSLVTFAFSTIVLDGQGLDCSMNSTSQYRTSLYENNIVVATNVNSSVNAAAGDYHLDAASLGIDAAVPGDIVPSADYDGNARPLAAAADIGAFERLP